MVFPFFFVCSLLEHCKISIEIGETWQKQSFAKAENAKNKYQTKEKRAEGKHILFTHPQGNPPLHRSSPTPFLLSISNSSEQLSMREIFPQFAGIQEESV